MLLVQFWNGVHAVGSVTASICWSGGGAWLGVSRLGEESWIRVRVRSVGKTHNTPLILFLIETQTQNYLHSNTLNEGRCVGHRHRAIIWYGEQLICRHGDSVLVDTVITGAVRQAQKVQLSVSQMFPENYGQCTDTNLIIYIYLYKS